MSGLHAFLGTRDNLPAGIEDMQSNEKSQRIQARMVEMGFSSKISTKKDREVLKTESGRTLTTRQAIGDQQRVATPPFIIQGHRTHAQNTSSQAQDSLQVQGGLDKPTAASAIQEESKDCFDTDVEGLEDVTATSKLNHPIDGHSNYEILAVDTNFSHELVQSVENAIFAIGRRDSYDHRISATSSESEHLQSAQQSFKGDELGVQETSAKIKTPNSSQLRKSTRLTSPTASLRALSRDELRHSGIQIQSAQTVAGIPQAAAPVESGISWNELSRQKASNFPGRWNPSSLHSYEYIPDFAASTAYQTRKLQQPAISSIEKSHDQPIAEDNQRIVQGGFIEAPNQRFQPVILTRASERDQAISVPTMSNEESLSTSSEREASKSNKRASINAGSSIRKRAWAPSFDIASLSRTKFKDLISEPFDPTGNISNYGHPPNVATLPLAKELLQLYQLDLPEDERWQYRQKYFSSLNINQYDECGELLVRQFDEVIAKYRQIRRRKRQLAQRFEDEIAVREQQIDIRKNSVERDLSHLKRTGQSIVHRSAT